MAAQLSEGHRGSLSEMHPAVTRRWLTWANALTGVRALAAPALAAAIVGSGPAAAPAALALFVLAVVTDFADGRVARHRGEASALGGLLDHAVDATFVVVGLAAFAWRGFVPVALPPLIAIAFLQYALDSRAHTGRQLRASFLGRWNGIAYFVLLGILVVRNGIGIPWPPDALVTLLGWVLVASTLVSIADRALAILRSRE